MRTNKFVGWRESGVHDVAVVLEIKLEQKRKQKQKCYPRCFTKSYDMTMI